MIIGIVNAKGGVGKSAIAVHLAVWLAEAGHRVGFVDADPNESSSDWLAEASPKGEDGTPKIKITRLLTKEEIVDLVPQLQTEADFVVVDGPAGLYETSRAICVMADMVVLPCCPCISDLKATIRAIHVVQAVQEIRQGQPNYIVLPNKIQLHYRLSADLLQTLKQQEINFGDGLSTRQAYAIAAQNGSVVWRLKSSGAREATAELQFFFQKLLSYESPRNPSLNERRASQA